MSAQLRVTRKPHNEVAGSVRHVYASSGTYFLWIKTDSCANVTSYKVIIWAVSKRLLSQYTKEFWEAETTVTVGLLLC